MIRSRRKLVWGAALVIIALALCWWHPWSHITIRETINPIDGAVMVWVPAGTFRMGTSDGDLLRWSRQHGWQMVRMTLLEVLTRRFGYWNECPAHPVFLDGYWLYKYEVTVAQYRRFCRATGRMMPEHPWWGWRDTHPMVNVSWFDAAAYAKWAGAALPSEAQWEKAARGTDRRLYPWGDVWDADKCANLDNSSDSVHPVGSFPADISPYGAQDLAGNVSEWCADWYGVGYYRHAPRRNPTGPSTGTDRVVRGGFWFGYNGNSRSTGRFYYNPTSDNYSIGFRCASLSPGPK